MYPIAGKVVSEITRYVYKEGWLFKQAVCNGYAISEERAQIGSSSLGPLPIDLPREKAEALKKGEILEFVISQSMHRDVQHVVSMVPESTHLYDYEDTVLECEECHAKIRPSELRADATDDGVDEAWSNCICPRCGAWDCCDFEYESLASVLKEEGLRSEVLGG